MCVCSSIPWTWMAIQEPQVKQVFCNFSYFKIVFKLFHSPVCSRIYLHCEVVADCYWLNTPCLKCPYADCSRTSVTSLWATVETQQIPGSSSTSCFCRGGIMEQDLVCVILLLLYLENQCLNRRKTGIISSFFIFLFILFLFFCFVLC